PPAVASSAAAHAAHACLLPHAPAFFLPGPAGPRYLHSSPTRRSSDLWPLLGVALIHRYGRITPGEEMVLVIVAAVHRGDDDQDQDRKSTRLNSSHVATSYALFCSKKKTSPGEAA